MPQRHSEIPPKPPSEEQLRAQELRRYDQIRLWLETDDGPEPDFYRKDNR